MAAFASQCHYKKFSLSLNINMLCVSETWSTPHMAGAIARMADSGRAKVKEVCANSAVKSNLLIQDAQLRTH